MKRILTWIVCGLLGAGMIRYGNFELQYHQYNNVKRFEQSKPEELFFITLGPVAFLLAIILNLEKCNQMNGHCMGVYINPELIFPNNHPNAMPALNHKLFYADNPQ